jgi:predicted DNA-binding transcriptional regulator AlpA
MLNDADCQNAICTQPKRRHRIYDGGGLYLEVSPAGSKRWFWKFYPDGKESRLALGSYPAVSLLVARTSRDAAKKARRPDELKRPPSLTKVKSRRVDVQPLSAAKIPSALLTMKTACAISGMAAATLYRKSASDPTFPKLVKIGARCTRIRAGELAAWLDKQ